MNQLKKNAQAVLRGNWQNGFTIPCQGLYPFQWNWDSGFIALGWAHIDPEHAKQEIRSLLKGQWSNGFLPHIVFHNPSDSYYPGPEVHGAELSPYSPEIPTSGITQPPVLGFILEYIYKRLDADPSFLDFVASAYDAVYANHEYFYTQRDPQQEGLVYICHNWEAGTDNTPVWDFIWDTFTVPQYDLPRKDTSLIDASHRPTNAEYCYYIHLIELFKTWNYEDARIAAESPFLVQDPLFNSMLIASNNSLIRLGKLLGRSSQVSQLQAWNTKAKQRFNEKLYDSELGGYVYYDLRGERKLSHLSSSSFTPLFAEIPSAAQAAALIAHLDGGRFSGAQHERLLCASFDPTSSLFNSQKYWRGPIWINLNWLIYEGLLNYGAKDTAAQIRTDSIALIEKYGFYEYFECDRIKNETLVTGYGGNNFSWSAALILDLLKSQ